ncbi:MAG: tetratricopeptide repeat protein, partial [Gammaproteobacteria bacterium]
MIIGLKTRMLTIPAMRCCHALFLLALAGISTSAGAALFRNTEQDAAHLFREGDYDAAAETFTDNYKRGVALYRAGRYTDAGEAFSSVERKEVKADALYNLGNTRYKLKDYEGAVESYEQSLALRADDEDTLHNLKLAKKKIEQYSSEELQEEAQEEKEEQQDKKEEKKEEKEQEQEQQEQ